MNIYCYSTVFNVAFFPVFLSDYLLVHLPFGYFGQTTGTQFQLFLCQCVGLFGGFELGFSIFIEDF